MDGQPLAALEAIAEKDGAVSHVTVKTALDSAFKNLKAEIPAKTEGKDGKAHFQLLQMQKLKYRQRRKARPPHRRAGPTAGYYGGDETAGRKKDKG